MLRFQRGCYGTQMKRDLLVKPISPNKSSYDESKMRGEARRVTPSTWSTNSPWKPWEWDDVEPDTPQDSPPSYTLEHEGKEGGCQAASNSADSSVSVGWKMRRKNGNKVFKTRLIGREVAQLLAQGTWWTAKAKLNMMQPRMKSHRFP